jgi:hypothetical protein
MVNNNDPHREPSASGAAESPGKPVPADLPPVTLGETLRRLLTAALSFATAGFFLIAWQAPLAFEDGAWVKLGVGVILAEFLVIHSGTIVTELAVRGAHRAGLVAVIAVYGLFALGLWWAFGGAEIGWLLIGLMLARGQALFHRPTVLDLAYSRRRSILSALLFLGLGGASVAAPLPPGGIDAALLDTLWPDRGGGVWEAEPWRALAMGAFYFTILGMVELRRPAAHWATAGSD